MKRIILILLFVSCSKEETILCDCSYSGKQKEALELINQYRYNKLVCDYDANLLAEQRVIEITTDLSHNGFKAVQNKQTGEILAYGFKDVKATVRAFENSEDHCNIMLNEKYNRVGIGIYESYYCVILIK